jgi:hypothetical protein
LPVPDHVLDGGDESGFDAADVRLHEVDVALRKNLRNAADLWLILVISFGRNLWANRNRGQKTFLNKFQMSRPRIWSIIVS